MIKEIFEFSDNRLQYNVLTDNKLVKKIKHCMKYLENHLPQNKLSKTNTFNFSKLKFDEGKNYEWFFLSNDKVTILVRQYRNHFTFFTLKKEEHAYFNRLSIFTLNDDFDKMKGDDKLHDSYCDNNFITLNEVLPELVRIIEEDKVHSLWNNLSFKRPDFTEVKLAFVGEESVYSLDLLIFACDEIFQIFLEKFAENDILNRLKELKVGDALGSAYTIASIKTEVQDGYYHGVGLTKYRNTDENKKADWSDVYSLARYEYETLFYGDMKERVTNYLFLNHQTIFDKTYTPNLMMMLQFTNLYVKEMHELFTAEGNEVDIKVFYSFIPEDYFSFLENSYRVRLKTTPKENN